MTFEGCKWFEVTERYAYNNITGVYLVFKGSKIRKNITLI